MHIQIECFWSQLNLAENERNVKITIQIVAHAIEIIQIHTRTHTQTNTIEGMYSSTKLSAYKLWCMFYMDRRVSNSNIIKNCWTTHIMKFSHKSTIITGQFFVNSTNKRDYLRPKPGMWLVIIYKMQMTSAVNSNEFTVCWKIVEPQSSTKVKRGNQVITELIALNNQKKKTSSSSSWSHQFFVGWNAICVLF